LCAACSHCAPTNGSRTAHEAGDVWFALAAALINAITVVAIARLVGGKPVGAHRIRVAGVA
jgi:hypothetical protein